MSVAADTFADFVDGLAEALDDHDRSGDDWAARHHFSRFHFDRMIKAVGGEAPQTLRRRILLERAAYRMITTKAPLLDIAVEMLNLDDFPVLIHLEHLERFLVFQILIPLPDGWFVLSTHGSVLV